MHILTLISLKYRKWSEKRMTATGAHAVLQDVEGGGIHSVGASTSSNTVIVIINVFFALLKVRIKGNKNK